MSSSTPIACDLSAISDDKVEDHKQNTETVFNAISEAREENNGYSFRLPADTDLIRKAGAFIARERLCCPFFKFTMTVQPEQQPVWLILTSRKGVKSYIEKTLLSQLDVPVTTTN